MSHFIKFRSFITDLNAIMIAKILHFTKLCFFFDRCFISQVLFNVVHYSYADDCDDVQRIMFKADDFILPPIFQRQRAYAAG